MERSGLCMSGENMCIIVSFIYIFIYLAVILIQVGAHRRRGKREEGKEE